MLSALPIVSWQSVAGRTYTVFYQTNLLALSSEGWLTSAVVNVAGFEGLHSVTNPTPEVATENQFFLVEVEKL